MFSRSLPVRISALRPRTALSVLVFVGVTFLGVACADHIVSVDGTRSQGITVRVGETVDIRLWAGALGIYVSPPAVSGSAVVFINVSTDGPTNPGGPTQRFRFRAESRGTAVVTFSPQQDAPVVVDTIVVH